MPYIHLHSSRVNQANNLKGASRKSQAEQAALSALLSNPENGGNTLLWNISEHLSAYSASHHSDRTAHSHCCENLKLNKDIS
jgi:hypothetical protein